MAVNLNNVRALVERARAVAAQQQANGGCRDPLNRSWFRIENRPASEPSQGPSTDIYLYDAIGEWGVTAQDFVDALRGVVTGTITMYVNCEGGEVFDGLAIYEALRRHPANVTAFIDGIAASAASFVVCAADKVIIAERGRVMVHDAHGIAMGNARDMRSMADLLDSLSDTIADIYAERTKGTRDDWRAAMQAAEGGPDGTWYDARAAVKAKLADEMVGGDAQGNTLSIVPPRDLSISPPIWDAAAFLATVDEISNPVQPVELPTGPALFAGLFDH